MSDGVKISELPASTARTGAEYTAVVQDGETRQMLLSDIGINGGVFITNVTPTGSGNVGDKTYSSGGTVLDSCLSDTELLNVSVLAITGHTNYMPVVLVNGETVTLVANADKPVFVGSVAIDLSGETEITAVHEDGASHTCTVTLETAPVVTMASFTGGYPGLQTELKAGDTHSLTVETDVDVVALEIENSGACVSQSFVISGRSWTASAVIADRGNTTQSLTARVRVQKSTGSWSEWYETTNAVALNNLRPSGSFGLVSYPAFQSALKDSETAVIAGVFSNFDTVIYSSPSSEVSIASPFEYEINKTVTRTGGTYNISTNNVRATLNRAANNATTVANGLVKIANTAATVAITLPYTRLRSPLTHTITLTASQQLYQAPTLNTPEGTWQGGGFSGSGTTWTRGLLVADGDIKGSYSFTGLAAVNLAGLTTDTITSGSDFTIGGFTLRTLTVAAYPNREVGIGTEVSTTSKLRCTNLSKGASGSLNFTYQATTTEAVDKYTITGGDTWYNCDGANATSNTAGTMQIELEEVV